MDRLELHVRQRRLEERRRRLGLVVQEALEGLRALAAAPPAGGGTNAALPGRVPPIQTCERRTSPGVLPRPPGWLEQHLVHLAAGGACTAAARLAGASARARAPPRSGSPRARLPPGRPAARRSRRAAGRRATTACLRSARRAPPPCGRSCRAERGVGQVRGERVQPAQGQERLVEAPAQPGGPGERRLGRQRRGHEGLERLAGRRDLDVPAGQGSLHGAGPNLK